MKKLFLLLLVLVLVLVLPVSAAGNLVNDGEGLLTVNEVSELEALYAEYAAHHGFAPILVTTDSFDGQSAQNYAEDFYDSHGYPNDGIAFLVSLTEAEWHILTNGACYDRIPDWEAEMIGEELVDYLRAGEFYEAFALFPDLALDAYRQESSLGNYGGVDAPVKGKNYPKTIAISMGVGLLIGLIAVGVMASRMKTVRQQNTASDYVRPGSMQLTNQRDIYLYSHVTRTAKPKSSSSGGGHGGGSRGGAGGRI